MCWISRAIASVLLGISATAGSLLFVLPAAASPELAGVVIDYKPRSQIAGKPAIAIKRDGNLYPVRDQELIYVGDTFVFGPALKKEAYVIVLVGASTRVTLTAAQPNLPDHSWPVLQSIAPMLVAAYRWINTSAGSEGPELRNAISRGSEAVDDSVVMFPSVRGSLALSNQGPAPLWLGWTGGKPPFTASIAQAGKPVEEVAVCKDVPEEQCVREVLLGNIKDGDEAIDITVRTAGGSTWTRKVVRTTLKRDEATADSTKLGNLGIFLNATALLDRGHGEYALESARELASIAHEYPPARVLLDHIREGRVP